jgi:hypothetical protein
MSQNSGEHGGVTRRSFLQTAALSGTAVLTGGIIYGDSLLAQATDAKNAAETNRTDEKSGVQNLRLIDVHYHWPKSARR